MSVCKLCRVYNILIGCVKIAVANVFFNRARKKVGVDVYKRQDLQYLDCHDRLLNCVVGTYVANSLYGTAENALGNEIKINGRNFKIVGVMEEQADSTESSEDDAIIIPYTIAQKLSGTFAISAYTFCAANKDVATEAQAAIRCV